MISLRERLHRFVDTLLLAPQAEVRPEEVERKIGMVTVNGVCSTAMTTLQGGPFLPAFALIFGATNYEVGLLATIGFLAQLAQLPSLWLVKNFPRRRAIIFLGAGASRLLWLFIIIMPFLFHGRGITYLLQWLAISAFVGAITGPAFNSWMKDIIPAQRLGHVFSRRMMWATGFSLGLTLLGGYFVDWWKNHRAVPAYGYSVLFLIGFGFGMVGLITVLLLPEPRMKMEPDLSLGDVIRSPLRDQNFRRLLRYMALWSFAVNMASPFFVVYMLTRIQISLFTITQLTALSHLTNLLFLRLWGPISDRFSNKSVLATSGLLFLVSMLAFIFTTAPNRYSLTIPILIGIHILSGASLAGINLGTNNIALKLSPAGTAYSYVTMFGLFNALAGAAAPLVAGTLADFFASRALVFTINWNAPAHRISFSALNLRALDFLFLIAFLVGLIALRALRRVSETGEVRDREVYAELINLLAQPFRTVTSVQMIRGLTTFPLQALKRSARADKTKPLTEASRS